MNLAGCTELQALLVDTTGSAADSQQTDESQSANDWAIQQVGESIRPTVSSVDARTSSTSGMSGSVNDDPVIIISHVIHDAA